MGAHLLPDCNESCKGFLDLGSCSLLLNQTQDGNDVDEIFLIVTSSIRRHLEVRPIGKLDLDFLGLPLVVKISRGNIRERWPSGQRAFLAFGVLDAFRRGLEVCAHNKLPEQSLQYETLEGALGWDS